LLTVDGLPHPPHELPLARAVLYGETVQDARWIIERADGTRVLAVGSARPVRGKDHQLVGAVLTLRDDTQRAENEERLRDQAQTLETLYRTGETLAGELDLQRVVQAVTDAAVKLTGAQFGAFFYNVENAAGESLMLYTLAGAERSAFDGFGMPRATAVFQPTFKGEGVVRSEDILADPRYGRSAPHHGMPQGHLPVRSYLAVPVTSRSGEVIGGLFFGHAEPGLFTERHERLLLGLATQASVAVDNARLFQTTVELNATLEARVEERTAERDRLWRNTQDIQIVLDHEGLLKAVSPALENILGWKPDELVGRNMFDFVLSEDHHPTLVALDEARAGGLPTVENRCRHRDGGHRWLSWVAAPEGDFIYASGRHVTKEKEQADALLLAQEALRQSQKMEAVGQLTGGIAHDFNNMLAVVIGSLDLMERKLDPQDQQLRRYIATANDAAQRAALLTQRLLAFSRQQPLKPEPVLVNSLVAGMSELIRGSISSEVRLETVLAAGIWHACVDRNQLESAILNLAVNARDAMPGGGRLTIETQNAHIDERYSAAHLDVPTGQYVLVAVSDTGTGMSREVLDKAFDPFFTTKGVGRGTGLGLSQVYGYIKQSAGHVKIYSEPGHGTTVKVYLPRFISKHEEVPVQEIAPALALGKALETVLVVEDEQAVREFCVEALSLLGYRVLEADGAEAALRLLDAHAEVALLFTDIVMPEVNGARLAEEALRRRPGLQVLFTTGYTRNAVVHNGVLDAGVQMISKPYSVEGLAAKLREVLDSK
jgi:PAS domain S-box-containing protein